MYVSAEYIPPENQKPRKFFLAARDKSRKTTLQDIANKARLTDKTNKNRSLSEEQESNFVKKQKQKINAFRKRLSQFGIDYDFQVWKICFSILQLIISNIQS